ncbi:MAG: hypothetical protein NT069_22530 [Planctomycetota bacterium]|nr:hypothetical protein [Planctomycetota bacterium]
MRPRLSCSVISPAQGMRGSASSPNPNRARAKDDLPLPDGPETRYSQPTRNSHGDRNRSRRLPKATTSERSSSHAPRLAGTSGAGPGGGGDGGEIISGGLVV